MHQLRAYKVSPEGQSEGKGGGREGEKTGLERGKRSMQERSGERVCTYLRQACYLLPQLTLEGRHYRIVLSCVTVGVAGLLLCNTFKKR
jgi:hypothetical protein